MLPSGGTYQSVIVSNIVRNQILQHSYSAREIILTLVKQVVPKTVPH